MFNLVLKKLHYYKNNFSSKLNLLTVVDRNWTSLQKYTSIFKGGLFINGDMLANYLLAVLNSHFLSPNIH